MDLGSLLRRAVRYSLRVSAPCRFRPVFPVLAFSLALASPLAFTGCAGSAAPGTQAAAGNHSVAPARALPATAREELERIPPPSKNRYMTVHGFESWENPYITVQPDMLTIHVLLADANPTSYGVGNMLRPLGARREELNVSPETLGQALSAIPQSAWPYGRVVAVEEAHKTPPKMEPLIRRNLETTVGTLNDLGLVAYDLPEASVR